jgi:hypothetical protein
MTLRSLSARPVTGAVASHSMQPDSSELQYAQAFTSKSLAICDVDESNILLPLSKPLLLSTFEDLCIEST